MAEILAGALVRAGDRPAAVWDHQLDNHIFGISSTTYITGEPAEPLVSVTFAAPTSGRVLLICGGIMRDTGLSNRKVEMAPEVYLGTDATGSLVLAADWETRGISSIVNWPQWHGFARATILSGLTGGSTYFARHMYRVNGTSTTSDILSRTLGVVPAP